MRRAPSLIYKDCPVKPANSILKRYLTSGLRQDLDSKIVLLGGPRQVGKTTIAKELYPKTAYLNYDITADRPAILKSAWPKDVDLVVLDELHKLNKWKNLLKGVYDDQGVRPRLLVTGSSRLDVIKKMGDSLAGRHFYWKLHPLCCKELKGQASPQQIMQAIMARSGFPEPYLSRSETFYKRWAKSHLDIILRQDLLDLASISDILAIETLIELLSHRVGQIVSYESLGQDLQRSPNTIRRWVQVLETLFVLFRVTPWSKSVARSLLKAPKYYFYDCARVQGSSGAKFENFVACSLRKEIDYVNDAAGTRLSLHYLRDLEKHEIDFVVTDAEKIRIALEAKYSDADFAPGFKAFAGPLKKSDAACYQLVAELRKPLESRHGTKVVDAADWLSRIDLQGLLISTNNAGSNPGTA